MKAEVGSFCGSRNQRSNPGSNVQTQDDVNDTANQRPENVAAKYGSHDGNHVRNGCQVTKWQNVVSWQDYGNQQRNWNQQQ